MNKAKILIVDDERFFISVLAELLKDEYSVSIAQTGEQALARANGERPPDLILLDISMPVMDGYEVCRRLKDCPKTQAIPVLFLTAKTDGDDEAKGFDLGAVDYITKPVSPSVVKARVKTHLALTRARDELNNYNRQLELVIEARTSKLTQEISERKRVEDQLRYQANYDVLTKLPNRILFRERLLQAVKQARRNDMMVSLLLIDLDRFKHINDTLGHHLGDCLLQEVATRLQSCIRDEDTAARLSGDEFTVTLLDVKQKDAAAVVAAKLLSELARPFLLEDNEIKISGSIGIASFPGDTAEYGEMIRFADMAMYRAKAKGGNGFEFFTPQMTNMLQERIDTEKNLDHALAENQLSLLYQPIIDVNLNRVIGAEALVRWDHPQQGTILPDEFVPVAEETGQMVAIGSWVLETACRHCKSWHALDRDPLTVSVNMSSRQLSQKHAFEDVVSQTLEATRLPAEYLNLEITESMMMEDTELAIEKLKVLKMLGISLSVDDFGTGYSSLSYIRRFPVDTLKIDRSFVHDVTEDSSDAALVSAIIAMANSLNLKVIAEGVETEAQRNFLKKQSCNLQQGFYFGKPMRVEQFEEFVLNFPESGCPN